MTLRRPLLQLMTLAPLALSGQAAPPTGLPRVSSGRLERLDNVASRYVDARPVDVWLPPGYDGQRPHAVLYMHDGQMLFDPASTWNQKAWEVDAQAAPLLAAGVLRDFIVVGVHNNGKWRHAEFFPEKFLPHLPEAVRQAFAERALHGGPPRSDAYLRFLVEELLPAVEARYAVRRTREQRFLMGSSMGGLISAYALCEYPQVFGGAACLSTHWIGGYERNEAIPSAALTYLRDRLPDPARVRWWMDRGTTELDALYDQAQPRIDALMAEKGFKPPGFVSKVFEGTGHNERAWRDRLPEVLRFLLGA
jgi:enterochelin esterase-like enzyme